MQNRCSLDLLDDILRKLCNTQCGYPHIFLGGNFNCGAIDWCSGNLYSNIPANPCDHTRLEIADKFGLIKHVKSPTHPTSGRTMRSLIEFFSDAVGYYGCYRRFTEKVNNVSKCVKFNFKKLLLRHTIDP